MHLFFHGFLGQNEDWDPLLAELPKTFPYQAISLPGHGDTPVALDLVLALHEKIPSAKTLIGYSAGGRIALALKDRFPDCYGSVIAISAHPGLQSTEEREKKRIIDEEWAHLLEEVPFEEFLEKWYSQNLFKTLPLTPLFLKKRKKGNPKLLSQFLTQFSLGCQRAPKLFPSTVFVCGKEDLKYVDLYRKLNQSVQLFFVEDAGHALHIEKPKALAHIIMEVTGEHNRN
jgi:2-succinyl-6-hydroxy-2,4-cyclohexadiene-1-carboxylate synthase